MSFQPLTEMQPFGEENSAKVQLEHSLSWLYLPARGLTRPLSALILGGASTKEYGTWRCTAPRLGLQTGSEHFSVIQLELTYPVNTSW